MGSKRCPGFEMRTFGHSHSRSPFSSLGRYWVLLFFLFFVTALYSSEEVFRKTVNCKLAQEAGAAF